MIDCRGFANKRICFCFKAQPQYNILYTLLSCHFLRLLVIFRGGFPVAQAPNAEKGMSKLCRSTSADRTTCCKFCSSVSGRNLGMKTDPSTNFSAEPVLHTSLIETWESIHDRRFNGHRDGNIEACYHQESGRQASRDTLGPSGKGVPRRAASYYPATNKSPQAEGEVPFLVWHLLYANQCYLATAAAQHCCGARAV